LSSIISDARAAEFREWLNMQMNNLRNLSTLVVTHIVSITDKASGQDDELPLRSELWFVIG
jgi:hypothetical protein